MPTELGRMATYLTAPSLRTAGASFEVYGKYALETAVPGRCTAIPALLEDRV